MWERLIMGAMSRLRSLKFDRMFGFGEVRRPARPRLLLETLEDRTVPSNVGGGTGLVPLGPQNNPNLTTGFNQASNGLVVSAPGQANPQNGAIVENNILVGNQIVPVLGAVTINGLARAGLFGPLFGGSVSNTFGSSNPFIPPWSPNAYGFGAGQNPNQPWMPAAYVNGLQNNLPSNSMIFGDHGVPPMQSYRPYLFTDRHIDNAPEETDEGESMPLSEPAAAEDQPIDEPADESILEVKFIGHAADRLEQTPAETKPPEARKDVFSPRLAVMGQDELPVRDKDLWLETSPSPKARNEDAPNSSEAQPASSVAGEDDSTLLTDLAFLTMPLESVGDFPAFLAAIIPEDWAA